MNFDIEQEIEAIFGDYVKIPSYTNTPEERRVEPFLESWFKAQPYFLENPTCWGLHPIPKDPLDRHVIWGMVRGKGEDTVVMIHHYDVVEIEDYETAKPFAHDVNQINHEIRSMRHKFDCESIEDLESGLWQFGRGTADMKAGGTIQMALLKKYSRDPDFKGNLILVCLPDEENLSAGMRSAAGLLKDLKKKFDLRYRLMINAEPNQSSSEANGVVYEGSVGKLMPIVYARGSLAHVGRIFEGLNPLHLMSELVVNTELNMDFSDTANTETTPPPSWLYLKDQKIHYDVSIPTSVRACLNLLTMKTGPDALLAKLQSSAEQSFAAVINRMNRSYQTYRKAMGQPIKSLPWTVNVKTFAQVFQEVSLTQGNDFIRSYQDQLKKIDRAVASEEKSLIDGSFELIEFCLEFSSDKSPILVIGLSPPYYPHVANREIQGLDHKIKQLSHTIHEFTMAQWQQPYLCKSYYTGISDLSYSSLSDTVDLTGSVAANMPLWGNTYQIPFDDIREISMPCINIGPWGKDFHKISERVLIRDLYQRTPGIMDFVITHILDQDA
jgi:arginine utilization protein RocB